MNFAVLTIFKPALVRMVITEWPVKEAARISC
jgi:hypothetical protein